MSLIDVYYPKKKEEEEKITPSQVAGIEIEQKKKKSLIDTYYPAKKAPEEIKVEKKPTPITKAKEAITGFVKGVVSLFKPKLISPIPEEEIIKPITKEITAVRQFKAGIGDVLYTAGATANWLGQEGIGTKFAQSGARLQALAPEELKQFEWKDLYDPSFYSTRVARSLPFSLSLIPVSIIGGYAGVGTAGAIGLGAFGRVVLGSIGAGLLSRPIESALEAGSTFDEQRRKGKSIEEADKAADKTFKLNLGLTGMDIVEFLTAFAPIKGGGKLIKGLKRTAGIAGNIAMEGAEEVIQRNIQLISQKEPLDIASRQAQEEFAIGGIMGGMLGTTGAIYERIKGGVRDSFATEYQKEVSKNIQAGLSSTQAEAKALDAITEKHPKEAEKIIKKTIDEITKTLPPVIKKELEIKAGEGIKPIEKPITEEVKPAAAAKIGKPTEEKFYINEATAEGRKFTEVKGKSVEIRPGVDTFIYKNEQNRWVVTEAKSGLQIGEVARTQKEAISIATETLEANKEKIESAIAKSIEERGISPRYKEKPVSPTPPPAEPTPSLEVKKPAPPVGEGREVAITEYKIGQKVQYEGKEYTIKKITEEATKTEAKGIRLRDEVGFEIVVQPEELEVKGKKPPAEEGKEVKIGDTFISDMGRKVTVEGFKNGDAIVDNGQYTIEVSSLKGANWEKIVTEPKKPTIAEAAKLVAPVEKPEEGVIIKEYGKPKPITPISGREVRPRELPGAIQVGPEKPGIPKEAVVEPSEITRRKLAERETVLGKRPSARLSKDEQVAINRQIEGLIAKNGDISHNYTEEDKRLLRQYTGAGGLEKGGAEGRGLLDEYYTPKPIVNFMWDKVKSLFGEFKYYTAFLEPAVGIGRFLEPLEDTRNVSAWEINKTSATITKVLFPNAMVNDRPFENNFVDNRGNASGISWQNINDIVIGNPPYGEHRGRFLGLGEEPKITKYEEYFLKRGLDTLSKNGILAYVMPSSFLRGSVDYAKEKIGEMARLEEAYRLPNGIFGTTDIGTDILIFRKGGKTDQVFLSDDNYFNNYPKRVLGEVLEGKGQYGADLVKGTLEEAMKRAGVKVEAKPMEVEEKPVPLEADLIPPEKELTVTREETPKAVVDATNKKAIIIPNKKDTTIKLSDVSPEEKELWSSVEVTGELSLDYIRKRFPDIDKLKEFKSNDIAVEPGVNNHFYPNVLYFQGNIYEKLDNLELRKSDLNTDQYQRQKEGLEKILPKPQIISEISLKPNSPFATEIELTTAEGKKYNLIAEFKMWMHGLPSEVFEDSGSWEIEQYIDGRIVNTGDKFRNIQIRKRRREIGDKLFNRYLREEVPPDESKQLEDIYNRNFNSYHRPEFNKIPLLSEVNKTFKKEPLEMKDLQKEGAAFLALKGTGLLGYDVGLGKTMTAITAINEVMKKGWVKRPLIVVPNGVYLQWVAELSDIIPNVKINSLANLGGRFKGNLSTLQVEDGTISLITYDGLTKLGFRMETYDSLTADLQDVMAGAETTKRAMAKERAKAEELTGKAIKGTTGVRFFEDLGFDHLTLDEVQNFKNIFASARFEKRKGNEYRNVRGSTSARGIKAYLMAQYVLKNNNGRNVFALSATPFTNSPMEIYSIISLMGKKRLEKLGLRNVNDFMSIFMDMKAKVVVKADQSVREEDVIERFTNLQQLQKLVTEFIDFRTGEEVGIERPDREKRTVTLYPTQQQVNYILQAQHLFNKKEGGAIVAITELRNITLSPYLSRYYTPPGADKGYYIYSLEEGKYVEVEGKPVELVDNVETFIHQNKDGSWAVSEARSGALILQRETKDFAIEQARDQLEGHGIAELQELIKSRVDKNGISPRFAPVAESGLEKLTYQTFVDNSPKIKFAIETLAQVRKDNKEATQVIYMIRGVPYFDLIKQYLIKVKKFRPEEVGIIAGGMNIDEKYDVQNRFNAGKIKVLIGSEAIKEGVNLQEKATDLYYLQLPFNPTDLLQVEGRIWRQGNMWKNVRIHYPLIENTVDSFMFQKLETKEKRIKNVWSYKGGGVSVGDLDFENMKLDLITDPVIRTRAEEIFETYKVEKELRVLRAEKAYSTRKIEKLDKLYDELREFKEYKQTAIKDNDSADVKYWTESASKKQTEIRRVEAEFAKKGIKVEDLKAKGAKWGEEITAKEKEIEALRKKYEVKIKEAEKERITLVAKPNDYAKLTAEIAEKNKTFFVKRKVLFGEFKKAPGGMAEMGGFSDVKSAEKTVKGIKSMEFPELVRIARDLSGDYPTLKKFKKALGRTYETGKIKLDYEIFKDYELAGKVLAHEIGHLADLLPDYVSARGNLVGRIATLNKQLKWKYGELDNKVLREELLALSKKWKPYDEGANEGYTKYRRKASELYADAISVLLNDPDLLEQEAPNFWKGFFEYFNRKPAVQENFLLLWDLLNEGEEEVINQRIRGISKMFDKGEDIWSAKTIEKKKIKTNIFHVIRILFDDKNFQLNRRVQREMKVGTKIEDRLNPMYEFAGLNYLEGKLKNFVADNFQTVKIKTAEIDESISFEDTELDGWGQLGAVLLLERAAYERGELANPKGYDPKTALATLEGIYKKLNPQNQQRLKDALELFRSGVQAVVKLAEDNGYYKPEMIQKMKANPAYATFQVLDYLDTYISASIKKQVGTLKEVANPATSTVMKAVATMKAIEFNNAKTAGIDFEREFHKEELEPAKKIWVGKFWEIIDSKDLSKGTVVIVRNGMPEGYYLDKDLADVFNHTSSQEIMMGAKLSRLLTGSPIYRALFTTINLGFQLVFNIRRDFWRYWKNVPDFTFGNALSSFPRAIVRYIQAAPHAFKETINSPDALIKEMENSKMLGLRFNDMFYNPDEAEQKQIERVLQRAGVLKATRRRNLLRPIYTLFSVFEGIGNFVERLPKIAGYIELKGKMPENELAQFIRNYVGSPNFRTYGKLTPISNNLLLFSNAFKEGIKSDFQIATTYKTSSGYKTRGGFWWKTLLSTLLPKALMLAATLGLLGEWTKKRMDDASEYDKTNYNIIPIGEDENGLSIILREAQDETGRMIGGFFWKLSHLITKKEKLGIADILQVVDFGAGQVPNLTPSIIGADAVITYLSGKNPYDKFRGRYVIPDKEFRAGMKYSFPIFMDWLIKNQGLGIVMPSYVPPGELTTLQKIISAPVLSNILGRWIKVTDQGRREKLQEIKRATQQKVSARQTEETLKIDEAIKEYNSGTKSMVRRLAIERQLVKDIVGNPPYYKERKAKKTNTIKKFKIALIKGEADQDINAVISATTNEEKVALLRDIKTQLDDKEYKDLIKLLTKEKIISKNVLTDLKRSK